MQTLVELLKAIKRNAPSWAHYVGVLLCAFFVLGFQHVHSLHDVCLLALSGGVFLLLATATQFLPGHRYSDSRRKSRRQIIGERDKNSPAGCQSKRRGDAVARRKNTQGSKMNRSSRK